jgi:hypothetical protein
MALQNAPTPSLIYPKSSVLYLMSRVQELTANVADLIQTLAGKDQLIAHYEVIFNDVASLKIRIGEIEAQAAAKTEDLMPPEHRGNGAALPTP